MTPVTPHEARRYAQLVNAGWSKPDAAFEVGRSRCGLTNACRREGIELRQTPLTKPAQITAYHIKRYKQIVARDRGAASRVVGFSRQGIWSAMRRLEQNEAVG